MAKKGCFKTLFNLLIIAGIITSFVMYPQWYKRQWNKVVGVYYVARGDCSLQKSNYQKAIDEYKHGLALYPNHYGAWYNLGNIYVTYEDYYSAIDAYANAIRYNPNYVLARMNYGIISAEKLGDFDGAIEQYNNIIKLRKKWSYLIFALNNLFTHKRSIGIAYYNKGVAYRQKSTYMDNKPHESKIYLKEAIKAYEESVKILKNDYDARYNLALAYHLNGDYNLAGLTYCKAIEIEPMNYEAHYNLAVLLNHLRYYKEALREINKANTLVTSKDSTTNQAKYVYEIMSSVTRSTLKEADGLQFIKDEVWSKDLSSVNDDDSKEKDVSKIVLDNFRTCEAKSIFRDEDNPDKSKEEDIDLEIP